MIRFLKFLGICSILLFMAGWIFHVEHFAVEKTNRYRQIANGWDSYYAGLYLQEGMSVTEKIKKTISSDLQHGRFRPAFFPYVVSPYALSPIIHSRDVTKDV